jgi:hypothetical protein
MGFDKGHKEFHTLDMSEGWHPLPGYPPGIEEKIIAGALDENAKQGNRTRPLRFAPGVYTMRRSSTNTGKRCSYSRAT